MSPIQRSCLKSFVNEGHEVSLYSYESSNDVPLGVSQRDASEILPQSFLFENRDRKGSFAGFSNLFRYQLLMSVSVSWFDVDVFCWNWPHENRDFVFGVEDHVGTVNGAVLRIPREHELGLFLLSEAREVAPSKVRWGQLGPVLLTYALKKLGLLDLALPQNILYPISPMDVWRLFDSREEASLRVDLADSWSIHLWNEVLRHSAPELKTHLPPENSLLGKKIRSFSDPEDAPVLPDTWGRDVLYPRLGRYNRLWSRARRRAGFLGGT